MLVHNEDSVKLQDISDISCDEHQKDTCNSAHTQWAPMDENEADPYKISIYKEY